MRVHVTTDRGIAAPVEYFVGVLCIWLVVFGPLGLALHAALLEGVSRVHAASMAPITGIAAGIIMLSVLGIFGVDAGSSAAFLITALIAVACIGAIWKRGGEWRSRSLIGAAVYTLIVITALQIPAFDTASSGPLGQSQSAATLQQIAAIDVLTGPQASVSEAVKRTAGAYEERFLGFERLAAYTVGLGDGDDADSSWSAYTMHSVIIGVLAALVTLPVLVLIRWRRIGFIGTIVVISIGVLSPVMMVAIGMARGDFVGVTPFVIGALASVMMARRDAGWWGIAIINAGAGVAIAGLSAVIPAAAAGAMWWGMHREEPEHAAQSEEPSDHRRVWLIGGVAALCSLIASMPSLVHGVLPSTRGLHATIIDGLSAWPFTWIGSSLEITVPTSGSDRVLLLLGIAVLIMVISVALRLKQRRELAMLVGVAVCVLVGGVIASIDLRSGLAVMDIAWLAAAPVIAVAMVRAIGQLRADGRDSAARRFGFFGPMLIGSLLVMFSVAASITSGTRYVHGLPWSKQAGIGSRSLLTIADPWLDYLIRGEQVATREPAVDIDRLTQPRNRYTGASVVYERPQMVVTSSNPFSSDPPSGYALRPELLGASAARVFEDVRGSGASTGDSLSGGSEPPREHDPVERAVSDGMPAGGLVIPGAEFPGCSIDQSRSSCIIDQPMVHGECSSADLSVARSTLEVRSVGKLRRTFADDEGRRSLMGIACWNVELDDDTSTLQIHTRDVGIVVPPLSADASPVGAWTRSADAPVSAVLGGDWLRDRGAKPQATASYGNGRLGGVFDLTLESQQVADISLGLGGTSGSITTVLQPGIGEWSRTVRSAVVQGDIVVTNESGTRLSLGRLVLRPIVHDPSCDVVLDARQGARIELAQYGALANPGDRQQDGAAGSEVRYPGLTFTISRVDRPGPGRNRVATVVAGTYVQSLGLPHHTLIDWTEQFGSSRIAPDCAGYKSMK